MKCRRILVIEPDLASQQALSAHLSENGYRVTLVSDTRTALEALMSAPLPDVILLELDLPDNTSGWKFLAHQKSTPTLASIPTLVFSRNIGHADLFPGRFFDKNGKFEALYESLERLCVEKEAAEAPAPKSEALPLLGLKMKPPVTDPAKRLRRRATMAQRQLELRLH